MSIATSAMRGVPVTLQSAGTTAANGTAIAIPNSFREHVFIIKGSAGVNAGAIQVESAESFDYAGTWAAQGSPVTVLASTELTVNLSGIFPFLRARISTGIGVGTVTVTYQGS